MPDYRTTEAGKLATRLRTIAHKASNAMASDNPDAHMIAVAIGRGDAETITALSGGIDRDGPSSAANPYPQMLKHYEKLELVPWRDMKPTLGRPFFACAEAHVWMDMMDRGKDPRHYSLLSCNNFGEVAAPCQNCNQWVDKAFAYVYRETAGYEGHVKQSPRYRQHKY